MATVTNDLSSQVLITYPAQVNGSSQLGSRVNVVPLATVSIGQDCIACQAIINRPYSSVNMVNIQEKIQGILLMGLRKIFSDDPVYPYTSDDLTTGLLINVPYASDLTEYKIPEVIVMDASFGAGSNGMMGGFLDEVRDINGVQIGSRYIDIIEFNIAIRCLSSVELEARTLANMMGNYVHRAYNGLFFNKGLIITGIQNPAGSPVERSPEKRWSFDVGVQGTARLITTQRSGNDNGLLQGLLQSVNVSDFFASKNKPLRKRCMK